MKNTLFALFDRVSFSAHTFLFITFAGRGLAPEDYALFLIIDSIRIYLTIYIDTSLSLSFVKFSHYDLSLKSKLLKFITYKKISRFLLVAVFSISALLYVKLSVWISVILAVGSTIFFSNISQYHHSSQNYKLLSVNNSLSTLILLFVFMFFDKYKLEFEIYEIYFILIVSRILPVIILFFIDSYLSSLIIKVSKVKLYNVDITKYSWGITINSYFSQAFNKGIFFVIPFYLGTADVAFFGAIWVLFGVFFLVNEAGNMLLFPQISELIKSLEALHIPETKKILIQLFFKSYLFVLVATILILFLYYYFGELIFRSVFNGKYTGFSDIFDYVLIWSLLLPSGRLFSTVFNALGLPSVNVYVNFISVMIVYGWLFIVSGIESVNTVLNMAIYYLLFINIFSILTLYMLTIKTNWFLKS